MARIPLVSYDDLDPEQHGLLEVLSDPTNVPGQYRHLLTSSTRNVFRTIGHQPSVLAQFRQLGGTLWDEIGLTTRQRELLILGVARALRSEYVWHQHVRIALANGVSEDEVRAISASRLGEFSPPEATLIRYAIAFARGDVTDDIHNEASETFDAEMLVGLGMSVSFYLTIVRMMDAFDIETEEPFVGWTLENVRQ